jgi:hypothetical protein
MEALLSLETPWTPCPSTQRRALCNTAPSTTALEPQNGYPRLLWEEGLTRPGHTADRPPPYSVEVKNVKVHLTPLHTLMTYTGKSSEFSEMLEITKRKVPRRLESSKPYPSKYCPNCSVFISCFHHSLSLSLSHTHTRILFRVYFHLTHLLLSLKVYTRTCM